MISAPTQGSSSTDTLRSRSERAAADEFRPRAHAACPLTSGAGSERASTSRVTASDRGSSCPASQFPSATQTLRANPTRPARRIARERLPAFLGECHAKEVDQDGASVPGWTERPPGSRGVSAEPPTFANLPPVVPLSEPGPAGPIASTPTGRSPGPRAAHSGSVASSANFVLNGQTSWVFYRFTRFRFKLTTGRNKTR